MVRTIFSLWLAAGSLLILSAASNAVNDHRPTQQSTSSRFHLPKSPPIVARFVSAILPNNRHKKELKHKNRVIEALNKEVEQLKDKLEEPSANWQQWTAETDNELQKRNSLIIRLEREVKSLNDALIQEKGNIDIFKREVDRLSARVYQTTENNDERQCCINELKKDNDKLQSTIDRLNQNNEESKKEIQSLEEVLKVVNQDAEENIDQTEALKKQRDELTAEVERIRQENKRFRSYFQNKVSSLPSNVRSQGYRDKKVPSVRYPQRRPYHLHQSASQYRGFASIEEEINDYHYEKKKGRFYRVIYDPRSGARKIYPMRPEAASTRSSQDVAVHCYERKEELIERRSPVIYWR